MQVAMMTASYWPGPEGGSEKQCRRLAQSLTDRGHQCCVISAKTCFRLPPHDGNVVVHRIGLLCPLEHWVERRMRGVFAALRLNGDRLQALLFWFMLPLRWLSRAGFMISLWLLSRRLGGNVDIVHVHETGWLAGLGVWLGRRWRVPVVCKVRNTPAMETIAYGIPWRSVLDRIRRDASYLALHTALRNELLDAGIPADRIHVIPNGVDMPDRRDEWQGGGGVLFVGNFTQGAAHKGFDVLLNAWAKVQAAIADTCLTMVGGGPYSVWLQMAEQLGCAGSIRFAGSVDDPRYFYLQADIVVLPSRREGMSNALLEAQSYGIPAVASDIDANLAVIEPGVTGVLFPAGDVDALASCIIDLLKQPERRVAMGNAARQRMKRHFSRSAITDMILCLYGNLTGIS